MDSQPSGGILLNPKRRMTAMEIRKQQKQRKSLGFTLNLASVNNFSSKDDEEDPPHQEELLKERTIFNESSVLSLKENNPTQNNNNNNNNMEDGESSNSMRMFNSQFDNFFEEFQTIRKESIINTQTQQMNMIGTGQQFHREDMKAHILKEINNFTLINELSFISAQPFTWFTDLYSDSMFLNQSNTETKTPISQSDKQHLRNQFVVYKYTKSQDSTAFSDIATPHAKENAMLQSQEIYLTMRNCFAYFTSQKSHYFYFVTSAFTILFFHSTQQKSNNSIVAIIWSKALKSFDKVLQDEGIEFFNVSEFSRAEHEVQLQNEKKKQQMEYDHQYHFNSGNEELNPEDIDKNNKNESSLPLPLTPLNIDKQSTVLIVKNKFVHLLWNSLMNWNLQTDENPQLSASSLTSHPSQTSAKFEMISNFEFLHSHKSSMKEFFNGSIISSDGASYSYLFDGQLQNQLPSKKSFDSLFQPLAAPLFSALNQEKNMPKLYNLKLKGDLPFPKIQELVKSLENHQINFAIFYHLNSASKYFVDNIIHHSSSSSQSTAPPAP